MAEKFIRWNDEKNIWLKQNRNICFEDVLSSRTNIIDTFVLKKFAIFLQQ